MSGIQYLVISKTVFSNQCSAIKPETSNQKQATRTETRNQ
jgi:hypothetical protein